MNKVSINGAMNTDLLIIGAGAAGLMAAVTAGESGLHAVLLERKQRPGLKLLMCGNNRCNLTSELSVTAMLAAYGAPSADFLATALKAFPPALLQKWFQQHGLPTTVHDDRRVFPKSKNADDVLHVFTDGMRNRAVPLVLNFPVQDIEAAKERFIVTGPNLQLNCRFLLLATGGVSYPKTGSVGDGQRFAKQFGHKLIPYQPGLVGFELKDAWLTAEPDVSFPNTVLTVATHQGIAGQTCGEILSTRWGARGPAMVNASRLVARQNLRKYHFSVDLHPQHDVEQLAHEILQRVRGAGHAAYAKVLSPDLLPKQAAAAFLKYVLQCKPTLPAASVAAGLCQKTAEALKSCPLHPTGTRPLKEAMVTIGGVDLADVNPQTMESRIQPGLFFAGEVLDIDGPTGGYNLQAAFSTARLAVQQIQTVS